MVTSASFCSVNDTPVPLDLGSPSLKLSLLAEQQFELGLSTAIGHVRLQSLARLLKAGDIGH